jgi:hypothetical protein
MFARFAIWHAVFSLLSNVYPHVRHVTFDFPSNIYEAEEVYVQQTILSLPSYWSVSYSKETQVTTVTIKGKADGCA